MLGKGKRIRISYFLYILVLGFCIIIIFVWELMLMLFCFEDRKILFYDKRVGFVSTESIVEIHMMIGLLSSLVSDGVLLTVFSLLGVDVKNSVFMLF